MVNSRICLKHHSMNEANIMKLLTWLKSFWTHRRKAKLRLVPRETTSTTSVNWPAQYHYKPDTKEKETQS